MNRTRAIISLVANLLVPGTGTLLLGLWRLGALQLGVLLADWIVVKATFGFAGFLLWPVHLLDVAFAVAVSLWAIATGGPNNRSTPRLY